MVKTKKYIINATLENDYYHALNNKKCCNNMHVKLLIIIKTLKFIITIIFNLIKNTPAQISINH